MRFVKPEFCYTITQTQLSHPDNIKTTIIINTFHVLYKGQCHKILSALFTRTVPQDFECALQGQCHKIMSALYKDSATRFWVRFTRTVPQDFECALSASKPSGDCGSGSIKYVGFFFKWQSCRIENVLKLSSLVLLKHNLKKNLWNVTRF